MERVWDQVIFKDKCTELHRKEFSSLAVMVEYVFVRLQEAVIKNAH